MGASSPAWVIGLSSQLWVVGCGSLKFGMGLMSLWVSQVLLRWLGFESVWIVVGCGGSGAKDRGGSVGLEFWVLWFFFFFFFLTGA